jgi:transposase
LFTGGYQSVRRFVRGLRGAGSPDARVIIETRPGEECQVDYGTGPRRATSFGYVR